MGVSFVTIGNFNIDNVISADGIVKLGQIGGNAVYSAIGTHIWSKDVGIFSLIPSNYPEDWLAELEHAGIDVRGVCRVNPPVDLEEWFFYQPDGSRIDHIYAPFRNFLYLNDTKKNLQKTEVASLLATIQDYPHEDKISFGKFRQINPLSTDAIPEAYWTIHGCHLAPNSFETHLALARAFHDRGVMVSVDPSVYKPNLSEDKLAELLSVIDIFLPSKKELAALFPGKDPERALLDMADMGPTAIGVKLGEEGSLIWDNTRKKLHHIPAFPSQVVDLTGAGDAFCGGFLVGMVETHDPKIAAAYGSISASLVIEKTDIRMALRFNRYQATLRLAHYKI